MKYFFYIAGLLGACLSVVIFMSSKSAIHEIEAFMVLLIAAVLFVGGAVLETLESIREDTWTSRQTLAAMNEDIRKQRP